MSDDLQAQLINECKMYEAAIDDTHDKKNSLMNDLRVTAQNHTTNIAALVEQIGGAVEEVGGPLYNATVNTSLRVRSGPGSNFPMVDDLVQGDIVAIWDEVEADGYTWGKLSETEELWAAVDFMTK